jgi:hypothetical protein
MDKRIHTIVKESTKRKLLEYGKGFLNEGIENLVKIAESQEVTVNVITVCKFEQKNRFRDKKKCK